MFSTKGYYWWKINQEQAVRVVQYLSEAYKIPPCKVEVKKGFGAYGMYQTRTRTIWMWNRNHIKTIFHEFYHHLDEMTNHKYNSDDNGGGPSGYGWQFADRMWEKLHEPLDPFDLSDTKLNVFGNSKREWECLL